MHLLASFRLTVARHPWIYWLAIAIVAGVVAVGSASALAGVDAARRSWGQQSTVWVASAAVSPGAPITATTRELPRAVVPVGAARENPSGTIARQRIGAGEIVTIDDVAAAGSAGLIPRGWVALAVPGSSQHFTSGDHLAVYSGAAFVSAGLVVDEGDSELMVAVPASAAPTLAAALLVDAVTLALTPGP
jgi:hypothetical protein